MPARRSRRGWPCNGKICRRRSQHRRLRLQPTPRSRPRSSRIPAPCWTWRRTRPPRPLVAADDDDGQLPQTRTGTCWRLCAPPVTWMPNFPNAGGSSPSGLGNCAVARNSLPRPRLQPRINSILGSRSLGLSCTPGSCRDSRSRIIVDDGTVGGT